jgi:hypothetical protein
MFSRTLQAIASLKLTVSLLSLAMFLIFAGTLAQASTGIGQTIEGYFRSGIAWVDLQLFIPRQVAQVHCSFPFPGGATLSALLILNLIAAHVVRFKMSRRRIGTLILHAGIILLLTGEFVTGWLSREGMITIDEGATSNYIEDAREVELALIDVSSAQTHRVTAVSQRVLEAAAEVPGERVRHEQLPFEIEVDRWMANSVLERNPTQSLATQGIGLEVEARALAPVSGVETDRVDAPTAYLTLHRDGRSLGRWLVSLNLLRPQELNIDGRKYELALRFKRTYKPYTLELIDFRHDKFVGTEVARNFSSRIRLIDPSRNTDRTVLISMNNPLRYAGETFYQASFKQGDSGTILLVVRNPGWLIPYVACALVSLGMLYHFGNSLVEFLRRHRKAQVSATGSTNRQTDTVPAVECPRSLAWRCNRSPDRASRAFSPACIDTLRHRSLRQHPCFRGWPREALRHGCPQRADGSERSSIDPDRGWNDPGNHLSARSDGPAGCGEGIPGRSRRSPGCPGAARSFIRAGGTSAAHRDRATLEQGGRTGRTCQPGTRQAARSIPARGP